MSQRTKEQDLEENRKTSLPLPKGTLQIRIRGPLTRLEAFYKLVKRVYPNCKLVRSNIIQDANDDCYHMFIDIIEPSDSAGDAETATVEERAE